MGSQRNFAIAAAPSGETFAPRLDSKRALGAQFFVTLLF